MRWRRTLVWLHRDIGFFCLGLTLIYAISGIAVNHRRDWDYNYGTESEFHDLGKPQQLLSDLPLTGMSPEQLAPAALARSHEEQLVVRIGARMGLSQPPRIVFWRGPDRLSLFYAEADRDVVDYVPSSGRAERTLRRPRPLLRPLNLLHLNHVDSPWTYLADTYATLLAFMAVSGVLIVRGRRGLRGRGGLLALAGILLPLVAYLLLGPS